MKRNSLFLVIFSLAVPMLRAGTFEIDPVHSSILFKVKHLGILPVTGRFNSVKGSFVYNKGKPKTWQVEAEIDATSIDTRVGKRDTHLKAPDFFDVERCPALIFKSVRVTGVKGNKAKLHGDLTMRCVTKRVVLNLEISGPVEDPWGNMRLGVVAKTTLDRTDFEIAWNKKTKKGDWVVGELVDVTLEIEAIEKKGLAE